MILLVLIVKHIHSMRAVDFRRFCFGVIRVANSVLIEG